MDFIDHRSTANFIFSLSATDEKFRITNNGNVGIGTSSPSTKLEVNGVITTAGLTTTADINFGDNDKAVFGAGSDLQIYHDGTDSYITDTTGGNLFINEEGAGYLMMKGSDLYFRNPSNADMIHAQSGGYVKLYHNASEKLATTSTGIDVTGTVTADGLTVVGTGAVGSFDRTDNNAIIELKRSGSVKGYIGANTGGDVLLYNGSAVQKLRIGSGGDISFYEDTGTTAKFFWDASEERLGIGNSSPATALDVTGTVTADGLTVEGSSAGGTYITSSSGSAAGDVKIEHIINSSRNLNTINSESGSGSAIALALATGETERLNIASNGDISFYEDTGTTAKLFWDASAESLGIGTTSPAAPLHLSGSSATNTKLRSEHTASSLQLDFVAATNSGIVGTATSHPLDFYTNNAERMRIDSAGNVGIGTSSPATPLHINTNVQAVAQLESSHANGSYAIWAVGGTKFGDVGSKKGISGTGNTTDFMVASRSTYPLVLGTGSTERMRIDSSGNLLVGTTDDSPFNNSAGSAADNGLALKENGQLQVASYKDTANSGAVVYLNRTSTDGNIIDFRKDGSTVGSIASVGGNRLAIGTGDVGLFFDSVGDELEPWSTTAGSVRDAAIDIGRSGGRFKDLYLSGGTWITGSVPRLNLNDSDGTNTIGEIRQLSGTIIIKSRNGTSNGVIRFSGDNGTTETEHARFDASGNFLVGKTSADNTTQGIRFLGSSGFMSIVRSNDNLVVLNRIDGDGTIMEFRTNGTTQGSISISGSTTSYNTSSDQRLKDNIVDAPSASDDIDAIQVRSFDWKADGSHQKYGMVAQELQNVAPEAVSGDANSDDMMGVDYSKLVPMMLKEIQSLRARVAQLEGEN